MLRRVAVVALVVLLQPFAASAQTIPIAQWNAFLATAGGTLTGPLLLPDGTAGAPSWAWASDADGTGTGMFRPVANNLGVAINGVEFIRLGASVWAVSVNARDSLGMSSAIGGTIDAFFTREGAALLQMGSDVNGATTAQTIKAPDGITGTDLSGGSQTFSCGRGTGAGAQPGGCVILNRALVTTTGTTAQTLQSAYITGATKALSTTSATATTIATISTTTLSAGGVTFFYTVEATSATAADACTGSINISWSNAAGTVAATAGAELGLAQSGSSGNITCAPTVTVATNVVSVKLTPVFTTIVPTAVRVFPSMLNNSRDSVVWN